MVILEIGLSGSDQQVIGAWVGNLEIVHLTLIVDSNLGRATSAGIIVILETIGARVIIGGACAILQLRLS